MQVPEKVHKADFDITNPIDYTVANNHDLVWGLLVNKYKMPAPKTPMETCEAAKLAVLKFGEPFANDMAMLHPDLDALLKETGHYGNCCSEKSNLVTDNISYNLPLLQKELDELVEKLNSGISDPFLRQQTVDRIAWLKVTIASQSKPGAQPGTSNPQSNNLMILGVLGILVVALVVATKGR